MPRRLHEDEDWDDDPEDDRGDEYDELDDDDGEPTIPCPYCKRAIHEDAQRCPYCEQYVSDEDATPTRKAWWIILGTLLCLFVVFLWILK